MTWKLAILIGVVGIIMLLGSAYLNRRARRAADGRPVDAEALRTAVLAALDRDDLVTATKIYRERTNASLLEAVEAVRGIDSERR
jgi:bifunctional ADP-heptose synthase (sugar kinase/adenylyltransferase)